MLVIGLTGGIGSGKSTVAKLFAMKGVPVIDADQIARDITQPEMPAFVSMIKHFGETVLAADGTLNRAKLRQIIFSDSKQRLWLENLLHPPIREAMKNEIQKISAPYCIAVIPLLLEVEFYAFINRILVVDTEEQAQIARVMARDQASQSEVEAILKNQANRKNRNARAHDIIVNDGEIDDLIPQVDALHDKYMRLAHSPSTSDL